MLLVLPLGAAEYEPTTNWPYVYEEFIPGHIKTHQGADISYDRLNVNLVSGKVHYVEDGVIMQADLNTIALLKGASYEQMLRNARVHDTDGDLTDRENTVTPGIAN